MTSDKKNPYFQVDGVPKIKKSVVVFADILGFKDETLRASDEKRADELLFKLSNTLEQAYIHLKHNNPDPRRWAIKTFSDNILVGFPISEDGGNEMIEAFFHFGILQWEMVRSGFFIRGGIAIGELFIDDDIVYGKGLIEAYEAEKMAHYPCIMLHRSAIDYLEFALPDWNKMLSDDLLRDMDYGTIFLNYLKVTVLLSEPLGKIYYDILLEHKKIIESKLEKFEDHPLTWSKYAWVANYHNYFCDQYEYFDESYKINLKKLNYPTIISKLAN